VGFVNETCVETSPCTLEVQPGTCHFVDADEVEPELTSYYHWVTSEKVCDGAELGRGLEGPVGFDSLGNERAMGGGSP